MISRTLYECLLLREPSASYTLLLILSLSLPFLVTPLCRENRIHFSPRERRKHNERCVFSYQATCISCSVANNLAAAVKRAVFLPRTEGAGKVKEIFGMPEADKEVLLLQLADWDPTRKLKVRNSCSSSSRGGDTFPENSDSLHPFSLLTKNARG